MAYPDSVREQAKRRWLEGNTTDEEIARDLNIARADTVRDWRRDEDWQADRELIDDMVADGLQRARVTVNGRHDQLAQALENEVIKALKARTGLNGMDPRDLRQLALALVAVQHVRRRALGMRDDMPTEMPKRRLKVEISVIESRKPPLEIEGAAETPTDPT